MSPRTSKQFEEIRVESRKKILDAAFVLFAQQGFNNTSIAQIAREAGISKGLIYNYFEKKEDLMKAIVLEGFEQGHEFFQEMMKAPAGKERLRLMIEMTFDFLVEKPQFNRLMGQISLQLDQFPELEQFVKAKYVSLLPLMAQFLRESGHPQPAAEARLLGALMDGIALQFIVLGEALPLEMMKNDLIQKYCT